MTPASRPENAEPIGLVTQLAAAVDEAAGERVLVFGSTPPTARDLDLLVTDDARQRLAAQLLAVGCVRRGDSLALFADCTAAEVELVSPRDFGISSGELVRLLAAASPVAGFVNLVTAAPEDDLLVLARLLQWGSWKESRRARLAAAMGGLAAARTRAAEWGVATELAALEAIAGGGAPPRARVRPGPRRPRVIALSGIDGSGKSTQARALEGTLRALGYDASIAWTPLSQNTWLAAVARPVKLALRVLRRGRPVVAEEPSGLHRDEGTELRGRSPAVRLAWTLLVAIANGTFHARKAFATDVVIFDRYLLDTAAHFRFRYGDASTYRLQNALVRLLSPRPVAAFFLDLPAEASLQRKPDDRWTSDELRLQEQLYREEAARLAVTRLDALRPQSELCAAIAAAAWRALG